MKLRAALFTFAIACIAGSGHASIDPYFGQAGVAQFSIDPGGSSASAVLVQPDGKILVSGSSLQTLSPNNYGNGAIVARFLPDGSLDTSFGTQGFWKPSVPVGPVVIRALALLPDGRILAGSGNVEGSGCYLFVFFCPEVPPFVARLMPNGSPDISWGGTGYVGAGLPVNIAGMTIFPDGKVMVLGSEGTSNLLPRSIVVRLLPDGRVDATFADAGFATIPTAPSMPQQYTGIRLLSNGTVLVAQFPYTGPFILTKVARWDPLAGTFHEFGSLAGIANCDSGHSTQAVPLSARELPDGKVLLACGSYFSRFVNLVRFNGDGSLDATFATNGALGYSTSTLVAPTSSGYIVVAIPVVDSFNEPDVTQATVRFLDANGQPDPAKGVQGTTVLPLPGPFVTVTAAVAAGESTVIVGGAGLVTNLFAARLGANGNVDTTFGTGGLATREFEPVPRPVSVEAVRKHRDGFVVVGRMAQLGFAARFAANGSPDLAFGQRGFTLFRISNAENGGIVTASDVLPDGRIVVAGTSLGIDLELNASSGKAAIPSGEGMTVVRLMADGRPDPTFLRAGMVVAAPANTGANRPFSVVPTGIALLPDGSYVLAGLGSDGFKPAATAQRIDADGNLVTSFGAGGLYAGTMPAFMTIEYVPASGQLLFGGANLAMERASTGGTRINAVSFGNSAFGAMRALPGGKVVFTTAGTPGISVTQMLSADGPPDPAFGVGGTSVLNLPGSINASAVERDSSGRTIVAATRGTNGSLADQLVVTRLLSTGVLDASFLGTGVALIAQNTYAPKLLLQADDGFIVADTSYPVGSLTLRRFLGATIPATADIDGDGIPDAIERAEGTNPLARDNDIFASAHLFARQQYRDFLRREGDAAGIDYYANAIGAGTMARSDVIQGFFNSPEFQGLGSPIARLYFATFLRAPDFGGLTFQMDALRSGASLAAIANAFSVSPEFQATYGALDNTQFVTLLYANVLGRAPGLGEIAYHVARLAGGASRGDVLAGFSESAEYQAATRNEVFVTMMYAGMLRRAPETMGLTFWVNYMDAGNSGLDLILAFLYSSEYRNRFLP